ncbi:MAG: OprO/OprP family phosphate-selective porin [Bacteroidales bacterium]|nr:OprO/OprP family phosphate-selective porin [Bacteroidales bacterium]
MKKVIGIIAGILMLLPFAGQTQGCMSGGDDGGSNVKGYIQPQFDYNFLGEGADGESLNQSTFKFNRARIGMVGNIPYDFSYYVFLETSPFKKENPYLLDAFITYKRLAPYASISVGSFKAPFSLELNTACHKLHTINRSRVVNQLASPDREIGAMITGNSSDFGFLGLDNKNIFSYSFAVLNGTGLGVADNNNAKDYAARVVFSPFNFLSVGGSYRYGKQPAQIEDAEKQDERMRWAAEMEIEKGNFLFQGEYIYGEDIGSYTTGGGCGAPLEVHQGSKTREGWWAHAMYMTDWRLQPVYKVEMYDQDSDIADNSQITQTFGINYFFNDWTRLQINYLYRAEQENYSLDGSVVGETDNDCLQVQLQVVF